MPSEPTFLEVLPLPASDLYRSDTDVIDGEILYPSTLQDPKHKGQR